MPRRKKSTSTRSKSDPHAIERSASNDTHFRLCHICNYLNESTDEILACQGCERTLADNERYREQFELNEGEQAWANPNAGLIRPEDLPSEEPVKGDDDGPFYYYGRRRLPRLAGLSVVW